MTTVLNHQQQTSIRQLAVTLFLTAIAPVAAYAHAQPKTHSTIQPKIQIVSGARQQTTYKSAFEAPLVVSVTNPQTQQALEGVPVQFETSSGLALNSPSATTDSSGLASVTLTGLAVGSYSVKAEIAGTPGAFVTFDHLRVDKAVLTIVPGDFFSNVGTIPAITQYTIQGFVNGETAETAQVSGTPLLTTAATKTSHDANYAVKGGVGTLQAPNYRFVAGFGTLVLVGGPKSDPTESSTLYDADGKPITLTEANETANAVRKAFLDQSDQSITIQLTSAGTGSARPVQPAKELSRADTKPTIPTHGAVKAVAGLNRQNDPATSKNAASLREVKSVATLRKADAVTSPENKNAPEVRGALASRANTLIPLPNLPSGKVQVATALTLKTAPAAEPSHPAGEIRNAFPPTAQ